MFRQSLFVQTERQFIRGRCGKIREAIVKTQHKDRRCERSGRNARVATLQPPQRIPTDKKSGRHIRSGNPALASRNGDVATELAKRMPGGKWKRGVSWHDKYRPEYLTFRQLKSAITDIFCHFCEERPFAHNRKVELADRGNAGEPENPAHGLPNHTGIDFT